VVNGEGGRMWDVKLSYQLMSHIVQSDLLV